MLVLLLYELILMLSDQLNQRVDILIGLLEEIGKTLVLLLVDELSIALFILVHQELHTLLLEPLLLLLLDALGVRVPVDHGLGLFAELGDARAVEVLEVLRVLDDRVQVLGVLLALLALSLLFLLAFHLLGDARFSKCLSLASFVEFRVERRLEGCVGSHARDDFAAQLRITFLY